MASGDLAVEAKGSNLDNRRMPHFYPLSGKKIKGLGVRKPTLIAPKPPNLLCLLDTPESKKGKEAA